MINTFLEKLSYHLENLDPNEWTKVKYNEIDFTISFIQRGRIIEAKALQGLVKIRRKKALLSPQDLLELKQNIDFCIQYPDDMLITPKDLGFKVYGRDLRIYDEPIALLDLNLYSIKNPILLFFLKCSNKRLRRLLKL